MSDGDQPRFLALVGPTAAGKTRLSMALAQRLDAEIVSMDSRQIYRGMDVGTAKPTLRERGRVPHHGLDLLDPDESYSAGAFARDARRWIREIRGRGRVPLLVGGTGFYLKAVMEPLFREPPVDDDRRDRLRDYLAGLDRRTLEAWTERLDPRRSDVAAEGGRQRLTRTLEVALLTGRPLSEWHEDDDELDGVPGLVVILTLDRDTLDSRIRTRAERMVEEGLLEEVARLMEAGYDRDDPGLTGAGYREMIDHLSGDLGLDEALDRMEVRTRQYSRRQLTWFRNQAPEGALRVDAEGPLEAQVAQVTGAWRSAGGEKRGRTSMDTERHEPMDDGTTSERGRDSMDRRVTR